METPPLQMPPGKDPYRAQQDFEHLRLIALLSKIYGVLAICCSSPFLGHLFVGITALVNPDALAGKGQPPPPSMGLLFLAIGLLVVGGGWTMGILSLYAARCIEKREKWGWIMGSACFNCIYMPLGTALGVFTIVVINRASVRALFGVPLKA